MELEHLDTISHILLCGLGGLFLTVIVVVVLWLLLTRWRHGPQV